MTTAMRKKPQQLQEKSNQKIYDNKLVTKEKQLRIAKSNEKKSERIEQKLKFYSSEQFIL